MFILKNGGKNKDAYLSVLLCYLKMGSCKSAPGGPSVTSLVPFLLPSSGLHLSWVRQVFTVRQVFSTLCYIWACILMPCKCLLLNAALKPGAPGAPSLPRSAPKPGALGLHDLSRCHSHQCRSCASLVSRDVSGIITFTRCRAAYLACVCYRCSCLQSCCVDIPGVRKVCHLTNRGFLTETAVFSSESFILTYINAEWAQSQCFPVSVSSLLPYHNFFLSCCLSPPLLPLPIIVSVTFKRSICLYFSWFLCLFCVPLHMT